MYEEKHRFFRMARRVPGVFYEPVGKENEPTDAVLVMHSDEDYLDCPTGPELAKRGFRVLCANVPSKEGMFFSQSEKMQAVKEAVDWLRNCPNVKKIYLMGHSGGATLMSAYQAIAENGVSVFQGREKILPHPDCGTLTPADGILLLDANWGNAIMQLFSLDPAAEKSNGMEINKEYDLFNPENGFDPNGSTFSQEFIEKFQHQQGLRNQETLHYALNRWTKIQSGEGKYEDDEPLVIAGAAQGFFNNKLYAQDIRLMSHTRGAYPLIHKDGSITNEIIHSLRTPENPKSMTGSLREGGRIMTVFNYLSSYAVRTEENYGYGADNVWGIDWESTYNSPVGNMEHVTVPALVMGMTAGWEYLASETIYEHSASTDKTIAFVEGASHRFSTDHHIEAYPGQYGDTMKTLHDYVAQWLEKHKD